MKTNMSIEGQAAAERQFINDHDLQEKVEIIVETLMTEERKFTAYTVTTILRKKRPDLEIAHERVRPTVRRYMQWAPEMLTGLWQKQDGVLFEDAKGPARLYFPTGSLATQEAPQAPEVVVLLPSAPSSFEPL